MKLLQTKTIRIGDKDYTIKLSIRAMLEFENLTGHSISDFKETVQEMIYIFFCAVKAGGSGLSYDEFLNLIDDEPEILKVFSDVIIDKDEKKAETR